MKITIVGGGNIGTQFAVHCSEKQHDVIIYTSQPEVFKTHLNIVDEEGRITHEGDIKKATADPKEAFSDVDLIIITLPPHLMEKIADIIYNNTDKRPLICVVPGNGGSECSFRKCIERGNTFFGIERVPAIARLIKKGETVKSTGYRDELHVASIPRTDANKCAHIISGIFEKRCTVVPSYLNLTMTPSNPILHTTRLYRLFSGWHNGIIYKSIPLFYEEWDNETSELLFACDDEVQTICRKLSDYELQYVKSLKEHYDSPTIEAMTKKISSIPAFKGLKTPTVEVEGGLIPDLHSRYFTADFSYGLYIIAQIGKLANVETPHIDNIMKWYNSIRIEEKDFLYCDYGINDEEDFRTFYSK